jgi:hypothetical protein
MHIKVFLKLKNPKNSLFWANLQKKQKKQKPNKTQITIYAPMIYTAPYRAV